MSSRTHRLTPRRSRRPNIGFGKIAAFEHQQARLFRQRREKQVSVIRRRRMAADLAKATTALNAAARSARPRGNYLEYRQPEHVLRQPHRPRSSAAMDHHLLQH
jgi:hypothetical protein